MTSVYDFQDRLKRLEIGQEIRKELAKNAEKLAELQTEQMSVGHNARGCKIGWYLNKDYAELKHTMNPKPGQGYVDLKLTGDFYEGVFAEIDMDDIIFDSTDSKSDDLQERYGEEIFGLDEEMTKQFQEQFYDDIMEKIQKALQV